MKLYQIVSPPADARVVMLFVARRGRKPLVVNAYHKDGKWCGALTHVEIKAQEGDLWAELPWDD